MKNYKNFFLYLSVFSIQISCTTVDSNTHKTQNKFHNYCETLNKNANKFSADLKGRYGGCWKVVRYTDIKNNKEVSTTLDNGEVRILDYSKNPATLQKCCYYQDGIFSKVCKGYTGIKVNSSGNDKNKSYEGGMESYHGDFMEVHFGEVNMVLERDDGTEISNAQEKHCSSLTENLHSN